MPNFDLYVLIYNKQKYQKVFLDFKACIITNKYRMHQLKI